jgi:hypothetical protein
MNDSRDGRLVYCVITDKTGDSVKTKTVRLSMKSANELAITQQPKMTYTKQGSTAKVTVKAVGDGLKYQWYIKNSGSSTWKKSSVTTSTYAVEMSSVSKNRQVYCVITDKYGDSVKTNVATLRMAATITTQPVNAAAATGTTAKITVKAVGDGLKYTWYFSDVDDATFKKTSTFKGNTYSVKMSEARDGRLVYCVITDAYGNKVTTDVVSLNMK